MDRKAGGGREGTFTILLVCTANICRSPGAERLLALELSRHDLADSFDIKIGSAGLRGWDDAEMDRHAAIALEARGGTAAGFRSRPLTEGIVAAGSLIMTATKAQRGDLVERFPQALRRAFTMKELAFLLAGTGTSSDAFSSAADLIADAYRRRGGSAIADPDVADPYGGTDAQHAEAMAQIHGAMATVAAALAYCTHS